MTQTGNHISNTPTRKKSTLNVTETGKMGQKIFNDVVNGIADLKPTKGRILIEVNLEVQDENLFKDDEVRRSKLIIEVELGNKHDIK